MVSYRPLRRAAMNDPDSQVGDETDADGTLSFADVLLSQTSRIMNSPIDKELRKSVLAVIYKYHKKIKNLVDNEPSPDHPIAEKSPYFEKTLKMLYFIERQWQHTLLAIFEKLSPDLSANSGLSESVRNNMLRCEWPGVCLRGDSHRTCKKYTVCPWCRYRHGYEIFRRFEPMLPHCDWIWMTTFYQIAEPMNEMDPETDEVKTGIVHAIVKNVCKKNRMWNYDAVIPLPAYDLKRKAWMLEVTIIAMGRGAAKPRELEAACDLTKWMSIPLIMGCLGTLSKSSPASLAKCVAKAVTYSPTLLYSEINEYEFWLLSNLSRCFRISYHGMPRQPNGKSDFAYNQ